MTKEPDTPVHDTPRKAPCLPALLAFRCPESLFCMPCIPLAPPAVFGLVGFRLDYPEKDAHEAPTED